MRTVMSKCMRCGSVYSEAESLPLDEDGMPCCRTCGNYEFEEIEECADCHEFYKTGKVNDSRYSDPEGYYGRCLKCLRKHRHDYDLLMEAGEYGGKENVPLNTFIAEMFQPEEIEQILLDVLKKENADCTEWIETDPEWFSAFLDDKDGKK